MSMLTPAQIQALNQRAVIGDPRTMPPGGGFTRGIPSGGMEGAGIPFRAPSGIVPGNFSTANLANRGGGTLPPLPPELKRISQFNDLRSRDMVNAFYADPEAYYAQRGGGAGAPGGMPQPIIGTAPKIIDGKLPMPNQGGGMVRTGEFIDTNRNGVDDRDEGQPTPGGFTPGGAPASDFVYSPEIGRTEMRLDPIQQQLLFGLDGQGGFIPGAMRAAERTFFDEEGRARVIPREIAGFSPDQTRAFEMARQIGETQTPYLEKAQRQYGRGLGSLTRELGNVADMVRGSVGAFDPSTGTQAYMNPFEEQVVQQTISDVMESGAQQDIAARAGDIAQGGESAFGSRARLGASERQRALGRGLGEAIGALRSGGFQQAQQRAMGEFARQQEQQRAAASQLGGLAGTQFGARAGYGGFLSDLGRQAQTGQLAGIRALSGAGAMQQQQQQAILDAQREAALQAQAAPLSQYRALMPFMSMIPSGLGTRIETRFTQAPSPLQAGIGTGLATLGALGNLFNPRRT